MKKVILMSIMALLVLFVVAPVMAAPATKTPFTAEVSFDFRNIDPGEEWITEDGIRHLKGAVSGGDLCIYVGTEEILGTLLLVHDLALDLNTGEGACHGKFVITVDGVGTFEGSEHGTHMITTYWGISGAVVAQGTGMFEGLKMMGSYEGEIIDGTVEMEMEGILLSPKG